MQIAERLKSPGPLDWLQGWYGAMCDGDWEHQQGIRLTTLDNPGWSLTVDLLATGLDELPPVAYCLSERSEHDWVGFKTDSGQWRGACGPLNLTELIAAFRAWAEPHLDPGDLFQTDSPEVIQ